MDAFKAHNTNVFPIKTFQKPLKILQDSLRTILWQHSVKSAPSYMRKKDRKLGKHCSYSPTYLHQHIMLKCVGKPQTILLTYLPNYFFTYLTTH